MPELSDLTIYLNAIKICNLIHQKIFDKKHSIEIPSMLSESIVKQKLELDDYEALSDENGNSDKNFDAQKKIGNDEINYYEIKASSSSKGTTTINLKIRANVLVWAYFDFSQNKIIMKQIKEFDKKTTLGDVFLPDRIKSITRNRVDKQDHTAEEKFTEVFKSDNNGRTTVTLDNFKWDEDQTIELSMDTLEVIRK